MGNKLTDRQEMFCREYVRCGNASESYRLAYPSSQKWTEKSIWNAGSRLLRNTVVSPRIKEIQSSIAEQAKIEAVEGARIYRKLIAYGMESLEDETGLKTPKMRNPTLALKATDSLMKLGGLLQEGQGSQTVTFQTLIIHTSEKNAENR